MEHQIFKSRTHVTKFASSHFLIRRGDGPRIRVSAGFGRGSFTLLQLRLEQARNLLRVLTFALEDADAYFADNALAVIDDDGDQE